MHYGIDEPMAEIMKKIKKIYIITIFRFQNFNCGWIHVLSIFHYNSREKKKTSNSVSDLNRKYEIHKQNTFQEGKSMTIFIL